MGKGGPWAQPRVGEAAVRAGGAGPPGYAGAGARALAGDDAGPLAAEPTPGTWPPGTNRRPWHGRVRRPHTAPRMGLGSSLPMDTPRLLSAQRPASRGPVLFPVCPSPWRPPPAQGT